MDLNIPRPVPRKDGDYRTFVTMGYGPPVAVIHLAEGGALDLNHLTAGDCDRLIRAAAKVKGQILDLEARAAAPHGRRNIYEGTCQLCGKPEDDELHAEPASPEEVAALADSITSGTPLLVTDLCQYHGGEGQSGSQCGACRDEHVVIGVDDYADHPDEADGFASAEQGRSLA